MLESLLAQITPYTYSCCRSYAVTPGLTRLGSAEGAVVVKRTLSLTASLPRIVRTGDNFLVG